MCIVIELPRKSADWGLALRGQGLQVSCFLYKDGDVLVHLHRKAAELRGCSSWAFRRCF